MEAFAVVSLPRGSAGIVATTRGVARLILTASDAATRQAVRREYPHAAHDAGLLPRFQAQLLEYFTGGRVTFDVPLDLGRLSSFQREVLRACRRIGYGQVRTYAELARGIGRPQAARAVGGALARNPVPLVIPCHRVIASDGGLGGFSAPQGVALKRRLLDLEAQGCR